MTSCETVTSFVRELRYGQVVAKVGSHRLYASELASYIPDSASPEDSTRLALQYINTWASDQLFTDVAERELSKSEKNVDSELEDYRHSLLKYRYEQKYVNQRLDTAVTKAQIEKYYDDHAENFKLSLPIAKAVYMNISADSPNLEIIKKKMRSDKPEARIEADSIAFSSAFRYTDFGDRWVDLVKLSREVGTDYGTLLSQVRDGYAELPDGNDSAQSPVQLHHLARENLPGGCPRNDSLKVSYVTNQPLNFLQSLRIVHEMLYLQKRLVAPHTSYVNVRVELCSVLVYHLTCHPVYYS